MLHNVNVGLIIETLKKMKTKLMILWGLMTHQFALFPCSKMDLETELNV